MNTANSKFKDLICHYSTELFNLNFDDYLRQHDDRTVIGVMINPTEKKFEELFGEFPDNFLSTINKDFHVSKAGYRVDIGAHFPDLEINSDVFLLNKELVDEPPESIDSLIIHELCHLMIDAKLLNDCEIPFGKKDKYHGQKLYKKTDIINVHRTRHDEEFCTLLAYACEIAAQKSELFDDRWSAIDLAMRYDTKGNLRN